RTFTSNTTGTGTGPGRFNALAPRPYMPGGSPPATTHSPGPPLRPAQHCALVAHVAALPAPATPSQAASPAGTMTGFPHRSAPPGGPAAPDPPPPPRTQRSM